MVGVEALSHSFSGTSAGLGVSALSVVVVELTLEVESSGRGFSSVGVTTVIGWMTERGAGIGVVEVGAATGWSVALTTVFCVVAVDVVPLLVSAPVVMALLVAVALVDGAATGPDDDAAGAGREGCTEGSNPR